MFLRAQIQIHSHKDFNKSRGELESALTGNPRCKQKYIEPDALKECKLNVSEFISKKKKKKHNLLQTKKSKRKVQGVPQSQTAALP